MFDIFYEVRGVKDPIDGNIVKFPSKDEALDYYYSVKDKYPEAAVYSVEYFNNDYNEFSRGEEVLITSNELESKKILPQDSELNIEDDEIFSKDDLYEDTHARVAKPAGDKIASYNNALKYAKKDNTPYIYGYSDNRTGKFFALDYPKKWNGDDKAFRSQYRNCATIYIAYPDKDFIYKETYDFDRMLEDLSSFESTHYDDELNDVREDFRECTGAVEQDAVVQCCMCGNVHLVKDMKEVGDGQWMCKNCENYENKLTADGAIRKCTKNGVITHTSDDLIKEDLDSDLKDYNVFIKYLKDNLDQDEALLRDAKNKKDNELVIQSLEKKIEADKDELDQYLPQAIKAKSDNLNSEKSDDIDLTDNDSNIHAKSEDDIDLDLNK